MFPPVNWWLLAYVALVPWLVCVCTAKRSRLVYLISFLFGVGFFHINVSWLYAVTPPGYFALCTYYALFFPLAAWPIRHMYLRHGVSVALTAPVAWVATEYLRSIAVLGFPWLLLAHTQYQNLTVIQISDLVGAYGVSFVLVMISGWLTDLLIQPILIWRSTSGTRLPIGSLTTLLVVLGTMVYGSTQRSRTFFEPGPKVAVVQHDFPMYVDDSPAGSTPLSVIADSYLELARKAASQKPDLIVLPETAMSGYLNDEFVNASPTDLDEIRRRRYPPTYPRNALASMQRFCREVRAKLQQLSDETGVPMILGSLAMEWRPTAIPARVDAFNSAFLFKPGETKPADRYDKIHLVLFGEYVPFRSTYPSVYKWLNARTPWGSEGIEYSLTAGERYEAFNFDAASQGGRRYRAAVPICYEEAMPYIARQFTRGEGEAGGKNIDMLLCISNDGWFLHTSELEQHMATAVFRAVENRIPLARSVNTGASGVIHPNGRIHMRVAMPEEKIALLAPVESAIRRLGDLAEKMENQQNDAAAYEAALTDLAKVLDEDLPGALSPIGAEFGYISQTLRYMTADFGALSQPARARALGRFRVLVTDYLAMLSRWRERPWTAPGFDISQLQCDRRTTLYTRWGDWFAQGTVYLFLMILLDWTLRRFRRLAAGKPKGAPPQ
jgi:apolipoprotein N-acyltransferase